MRRPAKLALYGAGGVLGLVLMAGVAGVIAVQTDWFKNKIREKIVSVTETVSGGRVEIGKFNYNWHGLTADVGPFVLHGTEPASAQPLFQAAKIQLGLKIISALKKDVDLAALTVIEPHVNLIVAPDGSTNIPKPRFSKPSSKNFAELLLDLKVRRFEIRDGFVQYDAKTIPLNVQAEHLHAALSYVDAGPRYLGELSSRQVRITSPAMKAPAAFDLYSKLALESNAIQVLDASVTVRDMNLRLKGSLNDLTSPHGSFDVSAALPLKEVNQIFGLPLRPSGGISFQGTATVETSPSFRYKLEGKLAGSGLAYAYQDVAIQNIGFSSQLEVTPAKIALPNIELSALGGRFRGSAQLLDLKTFAVKGTAQGLVLKDIATLGKQNIGELSGVASGTVELDGQITPKGVAGLTASTKLDIVPGKGGAPIQGAVSIDYNQQDGKIRFGQSQVTLGSTNATVSGTLGETLTVHVSTNNLEDIRPLFPLFGARAPEQLPVTLHQGSLTFDGTVTGPLANPRISGKLDATHVAVDKREFDRLAGTFDADKASATLQTFSVEQGKLKVDGQGRVGLHNWKVEDSSTISGTFSLRGGDIQKLLAENGGQQVPVTGSVTATVKASGTFESPLLNATIDADTVTAYGENFDHAHADVTYTGTALEVTNAELRSGPARITGSGAYNHPATDWSNGAVKFDISSSRLNLAQINHVEDFRKGLAGEMDLKASGSAKVVKNELALQSLNGQVAVRNVVVDGRPYGNLNLTATTHLPVLNVSATVDLDKIQLKGTGEWRMEGDYQGQAHIQIPRISFATLHDLAPGEHTRKDLPFDGFLQGDATISGPLDKLDALKADVSLSTVQVSAGPNVKPPAGTRPEDLVLKNADGKPVQFSGTLKSIEVRQADFVAKDTTLNVSGKLALDSKNPWDLSVKGRINLQILQIFNPDLLASGVSIINVGVRGPLTEPLVDGRLEVQNAALFLRDLPNGVDQANGLLLFDRNRATVQTLSAVTGGGTVTFEPGSFVGFRGLALVYRIQARAENVRYRSPEGVSVTGNANLSLMGTSDNSVLSGTVVVNRAAFNPRTDVGSILASSAKPVAVPATPNEYLRGIQFDVGIQTARSLDVETSLTRNIQADASLRLRGTPDRPVVLGNVTVGSGEIEFFGNKYTINRGTVNFYNASKVEPIIDIDLETKVRSITVDISLSGSINKLNFSYRSDPPLETNDIIALLAVGRTPSAAGPLGNSQIAQNSNYLSTGSNALLGQAIAPVSGRLQRFFGVSHIKIDPQLTDITSIPQARLTLEQQVSTDITLTYITNLSVTNQQIVRVEWDFSKQWSVVALRDENGAFSVDFQYRRRFK